MEGGDGIPPMVKIKQEVIEEEDEERQPSETEGYQVFFMAEDAIKEEEMTQDDVEEQLRRNDSEQNSLQDVDVEMPVTNTSSCQSDSMKGGDEIPPMVKVKEEVIEEEGERQPSETEGYQVFFMAEDAIKEEEMTQDDVEEQLRRNDSEQNSLQDVAVEMPVTTTSSCQSGGKNSWQNTHQDLDGLSEEDKGQDDRKQPNESRVGIPSFESSNQASNLPPSGENIAKDDLRGLTSERPVGKTSKQQVNIKQKKIFLAKNVNFVDNRQQRHKVKYRRVKNLLKKCRELSQVTECDVFLYVKDEFSKTTYWGTSDALQLFKPLMDSIVTRGDKRVRSVKFVASLNLDESPLGASSADSDAPASAGWLGKDIPERNPLNDTKRKMTKGKATEKRMRFSKNLEFQDVGIRRQKSWYRRRRGIFKKGHDLAELTKCEVFIYMKDESQRTAYWGTSEALQLFQSKLDSLVMEGLKAVQCFQFVVQPEAPKDILRRSSTSKETLDCHDPYAVFHGSVSSNQESRLAERCGSPLEPPSLFSERMGHSTPESKPVIPRHSALKSSSLTQKSSESKLPYGKGKTRKARQSTTTYKVCLTKNLEFKDKRDLRNKTKCRRVKSLFKKGYHLADITKCQVFVYVKDEFSKTTYWGTSDAIDLFQQTIDSLVIENDTAANLVRSVEFLTASKTCKELDSLETARTFLNPKTGKMEVNAEPKKVCLAKNLEFEDKKLVRYKIKYGRVKSLFKKGNDLAKITKCQVFLYVKDEFAKTTYWGTSDALQLFQSTIDSLVKREKQPVRSVQFVYTPSKASEVVESTSPTNSDAVHSGSQCSHHLELVPSNHKSDPMSAASGSSQDLAITCISNDRMIGETLDCKDLCARQCKSVQSNDKSLSSARASLVGSSHDDSAPEDTRVTPHSAARMSGVRTLKTSQRRSVQSLNEYQPSSARASSLGSSHDDSTPEDTRVTPHTAAQMSGVRTLKTSQRRSVQSCNESQPSSPRASSLGSSCDDSAAEDTRVTPHAAAQMSGVRTLKTSQRRSVQSLHESRPSSARASSLGSSHDDSAPEDTQVTSHTAARMSSVRTLKTSQRRSVQSRNESQPSSARASPLGSSHDSALEDTQVTPHAAARMSGVRALKTLQRRSVQSLNESQPSSARASSLGSSHDSAPEDTQVTPHTVARMSGVRTLKTSQRRSAPYSLRRRTTTPKST